MKPDADATECRRLRDIDDDERVRPPRHLRHQTTDRDAARLLDVAEPRAVDQQPPAARRGDPPPRGSLDAASRTELKRRLRRLGIRHGELHPKPALANPADVA